MFATRFRNLTVSTMSDKLTLGQIMVLISLALILILASACTSPTAAIEDTADSPTAIPPTDVPATAVPLKTETLLEAVKAGNVTEAQRHLEAGADPNLEENGVHPMVVATLGSNVEMVKLLVAHGGDINTKLPGDISLIEAADTGKQITEGQVQVMEFLFGQLVAQGWDINQSYGNGENHYTPLGFAIWKDRFTLAKLLIEAGADMEILDKNQRTVLMLSAEVGRAEEVLFLVNHGADIDFQGGWGYSALHYAAGDNLFQNDGEGDPVEVMKVLIEAGASLDLQNDAGMTALDIAIANGHDEIAQLLRDAGAQESP